MWSDDPEWTTRVSVIDWRLTGTLGLYRRVLALRPGDTLIINGALGWKDKWRDLGSAVLATAARRRIAVVVSDTTWVARSVPVESQVPALWSAASSLTRWMDRRLVGPETVFCFLSTREVEHFADATGGRAVFTPFMTSLPDEVLAAGIAPATARIRDEGLVFTGGNTLRDWDLLCEALGGLPVRVRVATRHTGRPWPANFDVGPCDDAEFFALAARAAVAVLALRADTPRSCGQQTYLNLLRLGTPVVVNDAPGVRDHLDGLPATRIVGADDAAAMRQNVVDLLGAAPSVLAEAERCQAIVEERYSPRAYLARLLTIAESVSSP
jgi:glycosyltransferase involved in cell wall biosynthesis